MMRAAVPHAWQDISVADASRPLPLPLVPLPAREPIGSPLPAPLTSFIGREGDTADVVDLLRQKDVRLVTLTGPGGVGKTRLAVRVAAELAPSFADGVVFVPLAAIGDAELVGGAISQALGVRETGDRPLVERLIAALAQKHLLLILDNFEHLLPAAILVPDLMGACPFLRVLATSRERLRVSGEREVQVQPLPLPERGASLSAQVLGESPAVRLFVERVRELDSGFVLGDVNAATIAEICRRLDGLPLAIELAAARGKVLSPVGLLSRLEQRLPLLIGGNRDVPA